MLQWTFKISLLLFADLVKVAFPLVLGSNLVHNFVDGAAYSTYNSIESYNSEKSKKYEIIFTGKNTWFQSDFRILKARAARSDFISKVDFFMPETSVKRIVFFVHFLMLYVVYFTLKNKSILCRMIVSGASGAQSRNNKVQSRADEIRAIVYLNANETLFISVGQMGSSVCQYTGVSHRLKTLSVTNYSGQKHPTAAGHVGQKPARLSWNGASSACNSKGWPN